LARPECWHAVWMPDSRNASPAFDSARDEGGGRRSEVIAVLQRASWAKSARLNWCRRGARRARWAVANTALSGQPDAMASLMRRTLTVTRAPILRSLRRMVSQVASRSNPSAEIPAPQGFLAFLLDSADALTGARRRACCTALRCRGDSRSRPRALSNSAGDRLQRREQICGINFVAPHHPIVDRLAAEQFEIRSG
jgi:hypothetical protein